MNIDEQWTATEDRLLHETHSFGEMLERLRGRISPLLIGDREWDGLLARASELPATIAAFPFGFELPLHEPRPRADLGVSVVGGSQPAAFFEKRGRSEDADPSAAGIAWLLAQTQSEESPLRHVIGRKMMLEYDIDSAKHAMNPDPGIFLRSAERPIVGDGAGQRLQDLGVVLDALVSAAGWDPDAAERRQVERLYLALEPGTRIESFGVFPSRERAIRLAMTDFRNTYDVMGFLERTGWRGPHSVVSSTVSHFEKLRAFVNVGVHFDVRGIGLGPTLGLSFLAKDRMSNDPGYWVDKPDQWTALFDGLREEDLAVPEKLAELTKWSSGAETLFGASGTFLLMRGLHHVKLVLTGDRFEQVKAYVFLLLCSWSQSGDSTG